MTRVDFEAAGLTMICGDSAAILATGELGDFDHTITDPPYESHMHEAKTGCRGIRSDGGKEMAGLDFDSIDEIRPIITPLLVQHTQKWLLAFCTLEGVAPWRDEIESAGGRYKRACCWYKPDGAPQFNGQGPALSIEAFVTAWCGAGHSRWNGGGRRNLWQYPTNNGTRDGRHPTEKPIALMADLIRCFTNPGDLILDPFAGSGTTLLAAAMTGRRCIGIEKDPKYFQVAIERIQSDMLIMQGQRHIEKKGAGQDVNNSEPPALFSLDAMASSQ